MPPPANQYPDLFKMFDSIVRDLGPWIKGYGFEGKGRRFDLAYPNGWRLMLGFEKSHHNRRVDETFRFGVTASLYDEDRRIRWEWRSSLDGPGKKRPNIDRRWQKLDPETAPNEFRESLQSAINAAADPRISHWDMLTYHSDPLVVAEKIKVCITESLLPSAALEVGGNTVPPLSGERF
jgi:hypothetical protein